MSDVLSVHQQLDFAIYGDGKLRGYNVVTGLYIVRGIETKEIGIAFIDFIGMQGTEFCVNTRIPEIEGELAGLGLNLHGIRLGGSEINVGPSFLSKNAECQNLRTDQNERSGHHQCGASRNVPDPGPWFALRESPHEKGQKQLGSQESKTRFRHGIGELFVNGVTMRGDVDRLNVPMRNNGIGREDCNDGQDDAE